MTPRAVDVSRSSGSRPDGATDDRTGRADTRRGLLAGATVLAGSLLLAGSPASALAAGGLSADAQTIEASVRLEQLLAVTYGTLAVRPSLDPELRDLFGLLADHEHQHAQALLALAEYLGGPPPAVPTLAQTERALPGLVRATTRPAALELAETLEKSELQSFYLNELTLTDVKLMELSAAVMCSDAQHLSLIHQASGTNPIPSAFEIGQETG